MGRTLPSITQTFMQEEQAFARFRQPCVEVPAIRRPVRLGSQPPAAAAYAAHALPMETFLLAMLLEEHKEVTRLAAWWRSCWKRPKRLGGR